ncbi:Extended Signal Peptide of Type V secretion system [Pseudomonas extremaustralis]|uniref:Extended Signal Peptide of Type V secretion system n=1 Tax=Pseudomonas extremaustralis TaxID=359110 RepID=A0ABY0N4F3_9PSED|nr:ESPR domain-containing protein [Pseudomonas extremaustralis]SDE90437.1 Extended Signal Peptide of Type V secretion system [Pseudomonas extremaustralis]
MNKDIYRLVWNTSLGALQVVSEAAKSKSCGGSGTRSLGGQCKAMVWPLALLSLSMASSAWAIPRITVTTGADAGAGSLREGLSSFGTVLIDPSVSSIVLSSNVAAANGLTSLTAAAPLTIAGASLAGSGGSLSLNGSNAGTLTTAISGVFTGTASNTGSASNGVTGADGAYSRTGTAGTGSVGTDGSYVAHTVNASSAVSGSFFALTNNATVTGGAGMSIVAAGSGGRGGRGGNSDYLYSGTHGGTGGTGGAGSSGGVSAGGGAGVSGSFFALVNNSTISGGHGANGVAGGAGGAGGNGGDWGKYGGNGGNGGLGGNGGTGGAGGAGVSGAGMQVFNTGTIQGGNGGLAGAAGQGEPQARQGMAIATQVRQA